MIKQLQYDSMTKSFFSKLWSSLMQQVTKTYFIKMEVQSLEIINSAHLVNEKYSQFSSILIN
jgi:hypothetical protein